MTAIRHVSGRDAAGNYIWEAREFYDHNPEHKRSYWLSTAINNPGFVQFRNMTETIAFHLQYAPDTEHIVTSWGRDVFIRNLIPDAVAKLAVEALGCVPDKES